VAHTYNPSYSEAEIRRICLWQIVQETLSPKYPPQKGAGGVAQVVQCLPNSSATRTKGKVKSINADFPVVSWLQREVTPVPLTITLPADQVRLVSF
jgi:hypothetical protein